MKICLSLIENMMHYKVQFKNFDPKEDPFILERAKIYKAGEEFCDGILYIARSSDLSNKIPANKHSGLISLGTPCIEHIHSPMHILSLHQDTDPVDVINTVNDIFWEFAALEKNMYTAVYTTGDVQSLVQLIKPYLNGNEIMVHNSAYKFIGYSNPTLHTNEISGVPQFDTDKYLPQELLSYFKNDIIFSQVRDLSEPFFYGPSILICRTLCMNVYYKGEYAARIILSEDVTPFVGYEPELIRFFQKYVQMVFSTSGISSDILPQKKLQEAFKRMVLGETIDENSLHSYLDGYGWKCNELFACGVLLLSDRDIRNDTSGIYVRTFNQDITHCCFFEANNQIVCLINLSYYENNLSNFMSSNTECFRDNYFKIGFSDTFNEIENLVFYYRQAMIALECGTKNIPHQWYFRYRDVFRFYIKELCLRDLTEQYLCAKEVSILKNYDEQNKSEYIKTLKSYIYNSKNAVLTAKELHLSRTAMNYRLKRISELTQLNYDDYSSMFDVQMSLEFFV